MLFLFNLIPIPPLDGSKILSSLLPAGPARIYGDFRAQFERNPIIGMVLVVMLVTLGGSVFGSLVYSVASIIAGA